MKKWFAIALVLAALTGCSFAPSSNTTAPDNSAPSASETPSGGSLEVDKGLLTAEFTIPASMMNGATQEDVEQTVAEKGYLSGTLNDDGSATYVMNKSDYTQYMEDYKAQIDQAMLDMCDSEDTPNIASVEANEGYTSFKVNLKSGEVSMLDSVAALTLYTYGGLYNAMNGTPANDIVVQYFGSDGTMLSESHMADMGK